MFENSDAPTKTLTEKQFQLQFMEMMGNVKLLINGISLIILFAVTLIVANTVAMSARERVTEIAVMRTLGFGRGHILGFILSESVLMSLLGGVLGVLLAKYVFIPGLVAAGNKTSISVWLINFKVSLADARARLRGLGRRRDPGGLRARDPVLAAQDRGRPAAGGVMAIPLKYNLRNLVARKTSTGMTAFVIGLVVAVFLCVLALVQGVDADPLGDGLDAQRHRDARRAPRPRCRASSPATRPTRCRRCRAPSATRPAKPYVSPELITLINVPRADGKTNSNVQVRGMAPDRHGGPAGREDRGRADVQRRRRTRRSSRRTSRSASRT